MTVDIIQLTDYELQTCEGGVAWNDVGFGIATASGAGIGAKAGASIGTAVGGPAGAAVGGAIGTVVGGAVGGIAYSLWD